MKDAPLVLTPEGLKCNLSEKDKVRFWSKVEKTPSCWMWNGGLTRKGYGSGSFGGIQHRMHRVAYMMEVGPIPDGLLVCHKCDNPTCVNPSHLFLGTAKDNRMDCINKGRGVWATGDRSSARLYPERRPRGESHCSAKCTEEQVREFKRLRLSGVSYLKIAKMFGLSNVSVSSAVRGKTWKHVI